jgi:hypothetical protein
MLFAMMVSMLMGQASSAVQPAARPPWIESLPEAPGRLYALGAADLGANEGQAITRASARARLEVAARLKTSVKGQTRVSTVTTELRQAGDKVTGYGERKVRDDVSVSVQGEDLPGLVVERTYVDVPGRSAYALAYLDLAQAASTLADRLGRLREDRARVGDERSRKARWRLRKIKGDLDRLDETSSLLSVTGTGLSLRLELQTERAALERRLGVLDKTELPPLDFSKLSVGLRSNVELPQGIEAYLAAQIRVCGLTHRNLGPDLILDLTFTGSAPGPEFIFVNSDVYQGVTYRLDMRMSLLEGGGLPTGRPASIQIIQKDSPEGMVDEFRRQFERRLPRLFAEFQNEMQ